MKKLGILLLFAALVAPTFVGCKPSNKVELPQKIDDESARTGGDLDEKENAQKAPSLDEEEPK